MSFKIDQNNKRYMYVYKMFAVKMLFERSRMDYILGIDGAVLARNGLLSYSRV